LSTAPLPFTHFSRYCWRTRKCAPSTPACQLSYRARFRRFRLGYLALNVSSPTVSSVDAIRCLIWCLRAIRFALRRGAGAFSHGLCVRDRQAPDLDGLFSLVVTVRMAPRGLEKSDSSERECSLLSVLFRRRWDQKRGQSSSVGWRYSSSPPYVRRRSPLCAFSVTRQPVAHPWLSIDVRHRGSA
jgi:hypothetical protein